MNRSRRTERFPALADEGLLVVSSFDHPEHGRVQCPSAPLVSAWLDRWGMPNRIVDSASGREVTREVGADTGWLVATTYADSDGRTTGIAVLSPSLLVEAASTAVSTWSACLRARRIVVPLFAPQCDRTLGAVPEAGTPQLPGPDGDEGGCRHPAGVRATVLGHRAERRTVLVVGAPHGGTDDLGEAEGVVPVPDVETAVRLSVPGGHDLAFVLAPCTDIRGADRIVAVLRERFPPLRGQHPDQWCYRSTDNRHALQAAVHNSDLVLSVPGAPPVPPRVRNAVGVRTLADLRPADLAQAATIALLGPPAAQASRPGSAVADLIAVLSGLGPVSVVHQRFTSDVSSYARTDV